jgi:colanic acid/amylovoran biosynthesis glycosyltransferase
MLTVAYITNQFPAPVEPYVWEEIEELRRRGTRVIACSVRRPGAALDADLRRWERETLYLCPPDFSGMWQAARMRVGKSNWLAESAHGVREQEPLGRRVRAAFHSCVGAYLAAALKGLGVRHIHAHHGYAASWIAMTAARLLGISFSMTLHGSDLLLHRAYLNTKLAHCKFCLTVSEFNRRHILEHYPAVSSRKIDAYHLGVGTNQTPPHEDEKPACSPLLMLAVGRLHPVKDHAFLVRGCGELKQRGVHFTCRIAGDGPERSSLTRLIHELGLEQEVKLLGHLSRQRLYAEYAMCDLVVLTSRSEGLPLVLMEAMAHGRTVLAPAITGIPELVTDGRTGFIYQPGSLSDFVGRVQEITELRRSLAPLTWAAREHVREHFNREKNLAAFADLFLARVSAREKTVQNEDPVLQQI